MHKIIVCRHCQQKNRVNIKNIKKYIIVGDVKWDCI